MQKTQGEQKHREKNGTFAARNLCCLLKIFAEELEGTGFGGQQFKDWATVI